MQQRHHPDEQWLMLELKEIRSRLMAMHTADMEVRMDVRNELRTLSRKLDRIIDTTEHIDSRVKPPSTQASPVSITPQPASSTSKKGFTINFANAKEMIVTAILLTILIGLLLGHYSLEDLKVIKNL